MWSLELFGAGSAIFRDMRGQFSGYSPFPNLPMVSTNLPDSACPPEIFLIQRDWIPRAGEVLPLCVKLCYIVETAVIAETCDLRIPFLNAYGENVG